MQAQYWILPYCNRLPGLPVSAKPAFPLHMLVMCSFGSFIGRTWINGCDSTMTALAKLCPPRALCNQLCCGKVVHPHHLLGLANLSAPPPLPAARRKDKRMWCPPSSSPPAMMVVAQSLQLLTEAIRKSTNPPFPSLGSLLGRRMTEVITPPLPCWACHGRSELRRGKHIYSGDGLRIRVRQT